MPFQVCKPVICLIAIFVADSVAGYTAPKRHIHKQGQAIKPAVKIYCIIMYRYYFPISYVIYPA